MNIIILITVVFLGIWLGVYLARRVRMRGLEKINKARQKRKEKAKQKIMDLLEQKEKITSANVQKFLNISSATTTRYLDELEKEGKIIQYGKTSQSYYKLK